MRDKVSGMVKLEVDMLVAREWSRCMYTSYKDGALCSLGTRMLIWTSRGVGLWEGGNYLEP